MAEAKEAVETVGVVQTVVSLVLYVRGSCGPDVWFRVLVAVRRNDVGNREIPCRVIKSYNWEYVKASGRQDLGDTGRGGGPKGCRDEVGGGVHFATAGNGGAVVGPMPTLGDMCEVNRLLGGGCWNRMTKEPLWDTLEEDEICVR